MKILDKTIQTITANSTNQHNSPTTITQPRTKWVTFTYIGPQTKFITERFKHTNVNTAFKTNSALGHILTHNTYNNTNNTSDKFHKNGIYQLTCKDCNKKYIGQTGHPFCTRFHKHFNDFKYGNGCSKFAQNLLQNRHSIGTMEEIMEVLQVAKKRKLMDTLERFHIYKETKLENQINDKNTVTQNILFDTIIHYLLSQINTNLPHSYSNNQLINRLTTKAPLLMLKQQQP